MELTKQFLEKVFSTKRMERYFALYPDDEARAIRHYECNLMLAESLYVSLSVLEVTLRNALCRELETMTGREDWYAIFPTTPGLRSLNRYITEDVPVGCFLIQQLGKKYNVPTPTVDAMTHTFPVEIIVANQDLKMRPGMFARATLNMGTLNHVVVPDLAIEKRSGSGDRFVYVYNNGKVSYNKVELGQRLGDRYELISGVPNGAQIVIEGQSKLADGKEVEVKK